MRNRIVLVAAVVAGFAVPAAVYAAPVDTPKSVPVMFAKSKTVKIALRNDSGATVELKVGDQIMSLDAGKTLALKVPAGTRIVRNNSAPNHAAGELLAEASSDLNNSTIAFK
jgi:hypothetical protein